MKLDFTNNRLPITDELVTQKLAFMGRSGSGKTYGAGRMVEGLLEASAQVVIVDPVGVWWGLRLQADGKHPGYEVPVLGGQHGDIPLESTGGRLIAEVVAQKGASVVLDISEFTLGEARRFVTDFAVTLLHEKKRHASPVMVVWEECQDFIPQHVRGDVAKLVGAMERLIKIGRNFGVGTTLISQRPQAVNKDALNQTEVLLVFQLTGPQERKAIGGWVHEKGWESSASGADWYTGVTKMEPGQAFLWSPGWLKTFGKVSIKQKWTFDASATPTFAAGRKAQELAPIDLASLSEAMKATIERAKDTDPAQLRARIRALETELAAARKTKEPKAVERVVEKLVVKDAQVQRLERVVEAMRAAAGAVEQGLALRRAQIEAPRVVAPKSAFEAHTGTPGVQRTIKMAPLPNGDTKIARAEREILAALRLFHPNPVSRKRIATLAGYAPSGGGFNNALGRLASLGFIEGRGDERVLTAVGLAHAPEPMVARRTTQDLVDLWCRKLTGKAKDILRFVASWGEGTTFTREQIAEAVDMEPKGGGFSNYLGTLTSNALIERTGNGQFMASRSLFP